MSKNLPDSDPLIELQLGDPRHDMAEQLFIRHAMEWQERVATSNTEWPLRDCARWCAEAADIAHRTISFYLSEADSERADLERENDGPPSGDEGDGAQT